MHRLGSQNEHLSQGARRVAMHRTATAVLSLVLSPVLLSRIWSGLLRTVLKSRQRMWMVF